MIVPSGQQRSPAAPSRTPPRDEALTRTVSGPAKLGKRTKLLVKRLQPGDIAIIDHRDLDRVSGEDLVAHGVRAVVNCASFSSGSYPNMGPLLLAQAGITLIECSDCDLFALLEDGNHIDLREGGIYRAGKLVSQGTELPLEEVLARTEALRAAIGDALEAFARNTVEHMLEERELLSGKLDLPSFNTDLRDRPALIVVRGVGVERDLRALRPYIRDVKPVIVAVDGGADAVLEAGFKPHMIVGDMDSASDRALRSGAELVVHAYPNGRAPGRDHLLSLDLPHKVVPAPGTSQDVAMLIAAEKGAQLIVSVGSQFNLIEFLDKSRRGMSSTFLTRLRIGEILVDAKGVSRLYRPRPGLAPVLSVFFVGLLTLIVVVLATPALSELAGLLWLQLEVLLGLR